MMDKHSMATCLLPGVTHYRRSEFFELKTGVGLFPLTEPCKFLKTMGLKWDIDE